MSALALVDLLLQSAALAALLAIVLYLLWLSRRKVATPGERFFLRTGEGLYLTAQGLRRGAFNKKGDVVAPAYDALSWQTAAEAEEERKLYYSLNSASVSTISKVSLYVEKEGEAK